MKISLSKIRLSGSQDTFKTLESARRSAKRASESNLPPPAIVSFSPAPNHAGKLIIANESTNDYMLHSIAVGKTSAYDSVINTSVNQAFNS